MRLSARTAPPRAAPPGPPWHHLQIPKDLVRACHHPRLRQTSGPRNPGWRSWMAFNCASCCCDAGAWMVSTYPVRSAFGPQLAAEDAAFARLLCSMRRAPATASWRGSSLPWLDSANSDHAYQTDLSVGRVRVARATSARRWRAEPGARFSARRGWLTTFPGG